MKYTARLTAPSIADKRYIHYSHGGYNTCIQIKDGRVLPNCVGYAQGRLLEILGKTSVDWNIPACNAEDWYVEAQKKGFKVGKEPKLGAIAVWRAGQTHNSLDGAGHVAVVEVIESNGDIITSNSAYGGQEFYTQRLSKASGYMYSPIRPLLGFIYCGIEFDNPNQTISQPAKSNITTKEDFTKSTIPERFKLINKDGKQIGSYTNYKLAENNARKYGVIVLDSVTKQTVYPSAEPVVTPTPVSQPIRKPFSADVLPNLTNGSYRVRKSFTDERTAKGSFSVGANAYKNWLSVKHLGYHIYDPNGKQMDY